MVDGHGETQACDEITKSKTVDLDAEAGDTARIDAAHVRYVAGAAPVPPRAGRSRDNVGVPAAGWIGPTLTVPTGVSGDYLDVVLPARSRRLRWWITGAAAIILLAGAALVLLQFRSDRSPQVRVVEQYFADLAAGDTTSAMNLVEDADSYRNAANPLLSAAVLARPADRPSGANVGGSTKATADGGHRATAITVSYTIGGIQVPQTIIVTSTSPGRYVLKAPFITIAVTGARSRAVRVNEVPFPDGATQLMAFPGLYDASVAGNQLIATATAHSTYETTSGAVRAEIWLPAPALAAGATAAVQSAVNHALEVCATSTAPAPAGCPLHYQDSGAKMTWKIAGYPTVTAKVTADGTVTFDDNGRPGTVRYVATTGGFLGLFPTSHSGDTAVDVAGTATVRTGGVSVTFT